MSDGDEVARSDPRVSRLRPEPGALPQGTRALYGLLGDSDREGWRRLYLTRALDSYAEFRAEDVVVASQIPPDEHPFLGEQATRVELAREARVDIVRNRRAVDLDEFDLDVRFTRLRGVVFQSDSFSHDKVVPEVDRSPFNRDPCRTSLFAPPCNENFGPLPASFDAPCPPPQSDDCGPVHTDPGHTACGTCHTDVGHTQCGTCLTDPGQTQCGDCRA